MRLRIHDLLLLEKFIKEERSEIEKGSGVEGKEIADTVTVVTVRR